MDLIFGRSWEEIQQMQQKKYSPKLIPLVNTKEEKTMSNKEKYAEAAKRLSAKVAREVRAQEGIAIRLAMFWKHYVPKEAPREIVRKLRILRNELALTIERNRELSQALSEDFSNSYYWHRDLRTRDIFEELLLVWRGSLGSETDEYRDLNDILQILRYTDRRIAEVYIDWRRLVLPLNGNF